MAVGLTHPKATVHVGDGFKFLTDYKNSFDVIKVTALGLAFDSHRVKIVVVPTSGDDPG